MHIVQANKALLHVSVFPAVVQFDRCAKQRGPRRAHLDRFDALPAGRRAILMVSDGVDLSSGISSASPSQSIDLDRAILRAQRKSVAVFSIYSPTSSNPNENSTLTLFGQGSLAKLSDETGGE